jgi:hypothetical protein
MYTKQANSPGTQLINQAKGSNHHTSATLPVPLSSDRSSHQCFQCKGGKAAAITAAYVQKNKLALWAALESVKGKQYTLTACVTVL